MPASLATSPSRVVWRSRARVCLLLSPFTLFLSLPIHSSALPRSLSLSPVRHGRAAELLRRSLLHCLDIIEPPRHRLRVCFRHLDRLPNPSSAAVRRAVVGTAAAATACHRTRCQEGHGLQLAVPLARRGRGYALLSPPCRCWLSRPSPAGPSCDVLQSLKKRTPGTSRSNSRKGKVLTTKSVTQMNSALKDLFVGFNFCKLQGPRCKTYMSFLLFL